VADDIFFPMLTLICKLLFSDGLEVTGKVEAVHVAVDYPIAYTGPSQRLSRRIANGTASDLELMFRVTSRREQAPLTMLSNGRYESWADSLSVAAA